MNDWVNKCEMRIIQFMQPLKMTNNCPISYWFTLSNTTAIKELR
jgi:hypothetical protein